MSSTMPYSSANGEIVLRKTRKLPCDGKVVVKLGDPVKSADVIARAQRPVEPVVCAIGTSLGVPPKNVTRLLRRWAGETVQRNEVLAEKKSFFGLRKKVYPSPIDGTVISGPHSTGEIVISPPDEEIDLRAGVAGRVVGILPQRGAVIETAATYVTGTGGYGGEVEGVLRLADDPTVELDAGMIGEKSAGVVLVGGRIGQGGLIRATRVGVAGLVVGSLSGDGFQWLMSSRPALTVLITEGHADTPMARTTSELLQKRAGMTAYLCGTRDDNYAMELIVALPGAHKAPLAIEPELAVGTAAQIVAGRAAGKRGRIAALPAVPSRLATGLMAAVAEIELEDGRSVCVCRNNLRLIS